VIQLLHWWHGLPLILPLFEWRRLAQNVIDHALSLHLVLCILPVDVLLQPLQSIKLVRSLVTHVENIPLHLHIVGDDSVGLGRLFQLDWRLWDWLYHR
jgi:hypothetical protein